MSFIIKDKKISYSRNSRFNTLTAKNPNELKNGESQASQSAHKPVINFPKFVSKHQKVLNQTKEHVKHGSEFGTMERK